MTTAEPRPSGRPEARADPRAWRAVWVVGSAGLALITAVLLPVGLLPQLSDTLGTSTGTLGLLVTVPSLVAAATAPVVGGYARRVDRRILLTAMVALSGLANVAAAFAPTFEALLAARIAIGIGVGGFWAVAAGVAPSLVPQRSVPKATAIVFGGVAAASAVGVPLTAQVGTTLGWRAGTVTVAVLSAIAAVAVLRLVPPLPPAPARGAGGARQLGAAIGRGSTVLLVATLVVAGHFATFTFARPILEEISQVSTGAIPAVLLAYGVAGLVGTTLAGRFAAARPRLAVQVIAAGMAVSVGALLALDHQPLLAVVVVVAWGIGYGALGPSLPIWLNRVTGDLHDLASAAYIAVFNGSIALGSAVGGAVVNAGWTPHPVAAAAWLTAGLLVAAVAFALVRPVRRGT